MAIARAYIRKKIDFKIIFQTILENSYMNLFYDWIKQFLPKGSYFCSVIFNLCYKWIKQFLFLCPFKDT